MRKSKRLSLRRLFLHFTLVCLVLGAIARFPEAVEGALRWAGGSLSAAVIVLQFVSSVVLLFAPTVAVCVFFARMLPNTNTTLFLAALGALARTAAWRCAARSRAQQTPRCGVTRGRQDSR